MFSIKNYVICKKVWKHTIMQNFTRIDVTSNLASLPRIRNARFGHLGPLGINMYILQERNILLYVRREQL